MSDLGRPVGWGLVRPPEVAGQPAELSGVGGRTGSVAEQGSASDGARAGCIGPCERAMVTAELAVGTLAALVLMVLLGGALSLIGVQLGNQAVASEVAEMVARGDQEAAEETRSRAEPAVQVRIEDSPGAVVVTVSRVVAPVGALGPEMTVRASARASWQPGEGS